jgi:hypothetical protein
MADGRSLGMVRRTPQAEGRAMIGWLFMEQARMAQLMQDQMAQAEACRRHLEALRMRAAMDELWRRRPSRQADIVDGEYTVVEPTPLLPPPTKAKP